MSSPWIDLESVLELLASTTGSGRRLIAVAGAPGSGKSTLAESLVARLNARQPGLAALLPMDGYHLDDVILDELGLKARKGAPETFDVGGLDHMLTRLRSRDEAVVAVPVFDRSIEIARAGARLIPQSVGLIVVEGNYLLLDEEYWDDFAKLCDYSIFIRVDEGDVRERLIARKAKGGISRAQAEAHYERCDGPNVRRILEHVCAHDEGYRLVERDGVSSLMPEGKDGVPNA